MIDSRLTPDASDRRRSAESPPRRMRTMVFRMRTDAPSNGGSEARRGAAGPAIAAAIFVGSLLVFLVRAPGLDYFLTNRDHGYQLCLGGQILLHRGGGRRRLSAARSVL